MDMRIGIIGGTGVYDSTLLNNFEETLPQTPFGKPSDSIVIGSINGRKIAFLPRHGKHHSYPPHKVPYKANIWAMKMLDVDRIIAPSAVGSLNENLHPGMMVFPDQFIDVSKSRDNTFYNDEAVHISMADPFCPELRLVAKHSADKLNIISHSGANYICIDGPRFSTRAESLFFKKYMMGDIIGMTLVPEIILAREAQICYATLATVTDYDVWHTTPVSATIVTQTIKKSAENIKMIIGDIIGQIPSQHTCVCRNALDEARL